MNRLQPRMRKLIFIALLTFTCLSTGSPMCPECYKNLPNMNGSSAEDGSQRRQIVIKIDSSWGSTTNAQIWNGSLAARDAWNNTTDGANHTTGYYFKVDQGSTQPNILIVTELPH